MMQQQKYPNFKPSGVVWLGDIPEDWQTRRFKSVIESTINGVWGSEPKHDENDFVCIRVADFCYDKVTVSDQNLTLRNIEPGQQYSRILDHGDLLIEKSGGGDTQPVGRIVKFSLNEQAVCSNFIARLITTKAIDNSFLAYVFYSAYSVNLNTRAIKQTTGIQNLDLYAYLCENFALPSIDEQKRIVDFLERETATIDTLIAKKQQLIHALQKQRMALISHVVTKGLNPNVQMKESGIEWLGKIPEHWKFARLKFVADIQTGLTLGKDYQNRETVQRPYLRVANVQDGYLDLETITMIDIPVEDTKRYELRTGDVLMTEGGDFDKLGRGYVWEGQIPGCLHQNHVFAVRPEENFLDSHFLALLMTSLHGKNYFTSTSQQTTNLATTNSTKLSDFPIPLPTREEQGLIVDYLRQQAATLDYLISRIDSGIKQLKEYRTVLISSAVTGKIDVRNR